MSTRGSLQKLIDELPDDRLQELLNYGEFLKWRLEHQSWQDFGRNQLAKAYGATEPEYSIADLRSENLQ